MLQELKNTDQTDLISVNITKHTFIKMLVQVSLEEGFVENNNNYHKLYLYSTKMCLVITGMVYFLVICLYEFTIMSLQ